MTWLAAYPRDFFWLVVMLSLWTLFEIALPRGRPTWRGRLRGLTFGAVYLVSALGAAVLVGGAADRLAMPSLIKTDHLWAVLAFPLLFDFLYYWFHRAQHSVSLLWRFHSVHHALRDMSAFNGYHHWSEEFLRTTFLAVPALLLLRISTAEFALVVTLMGYLGSYLHAQTAANLGILNRFVADNRTHRVHHSLEPRHIGHNFGLFTFWDQVFGTAYIPAADEWPEIGLGNRAETVSIKAYLLATDPN